MDSSQPSTIYRFSTTSRVFLGFLALFFLFVTGSIIVRLIQEPDRQGTIVFVAWLVYAGIFVTVGLYSIPHRVTIADDGIVTFTMVGRKVAIAARDVVSIRPQRFDFARQVVILRHREGKVRLPTVFDGFHDLLNQLKQLNPQIDLDRL